MGRDMVRIIGLTLALGMTVVASWIAVLGASFLNGSGPFLDATWYVTWTVQAGLAGVVGIIVGRAWGRDTSAVALVALVSAAWVGELVVATVLGPFLSNDLDPIHGPFVWLVATGGPIQPVAAAAGAVIGRASARPRAARATH
ncbi:MAG: hypothetical protein ABWZ82_08015 [Candidatus Limnocylindrales bacterium]